MGIGWIIKNYIFRTKRTTEEIYPSDINIVGARKYLMFLFFFAGAFLILKATGLSIYSLVSALITMFIVMVGTNIFIKFVAGAYRLLYKNAVEREIEKVEIEILLLPMMQIFATTALIYAALDVLLLDFLRIFLRIIIFSYLNYVIYYIIKARFGIVVEKARYIKIIIILVIIFITIADVYISFLGIALKLAN